jgi:hypothetical protein
MTPLSVSKPELAAQWHPTRNGALTPDMVGSGSGKKVWWKCQEGPDHEGEATPSKRAYTGHGCPFCRNRRVSATNSLSARFPELAAQWHSTKNGALKPDQIVAGTARKVWWRCPQGPDHEWQASPNSRSQWTGCPFCANLRVSLTNALSVRFPEIAAQWHPTRNGDLQPDQIVAGTHRKAWWQCSREILHEWQAEIASRTGGGRGCLVCAGKRRLVTNEFLARYAELAAEFERRHGGPGSEGIQLHTPRRRRLARAAEPNESRPSGAAADQHRSGRTLPRKRRRA